MREFWRWIERLFRQPVFWFVTAFGHFSILGGALLFRFFEGARYPQADFIDWYYWSISLATTVGNSPLVPESIGGKLTGIAVMVVGSLFLWTYAALFAASVITPSVQKFGREVRGMEAELAEVEREIRVDKKTLERLLEAIEELRKQRKS